MKKLIKHRRLLAFMLMIIMCMSTLMFTASATEVSVALYDATNTSRRGGTGYVSGTSTTASARTWSSAYCDLPTEYVWVDFSAYTYGTTVWKPVVNGVEVTMGVQNTGNMVDTISAVNNDAGSIYYIVSSHVIERENCYFSGSATYYVP